MMVSVYQDTSKDAWDEIQPSVQSMEQQVCKFILRQGPSTCWDVEVGLGFKHQTASARIRGLVLGEVLQDSGQRGTLPSGRSAILWELIR